jgi:hypothetical protein
MEAAAMNIFTPKAPAAPIPTPAAPPSPPPVAPAQAPPAEPKLSDQEVSILTFERQWWRYAGAKEQAIRDNFDMSPTRYYQTLNAMLDSADAMAHDPALVKRLRRLRASRLRARGRD